MMKGSISHLIPNLLTIGDQSNTNNSHFLSKSFLGVCFMGGSNFEEFLNFEDVS